MGMNKDECWHIVICKWNLSFFENTLYHKGYGDIWLSIITLEGETRVGIISRVLVANQFGSSLGMHA